MVIPKNSQQTVILSALREIQNGETGQQLIETLRRRFSVLSEAQAAGYAAIAMQRAADAEALTASFGEESPVALPVYPQGQGENRFAFFRFRGQEPGGRGWTRDVHIRVESGDTLQSLTSKANDALQEILGETVRGGDDTAPFNAPGEVPSIQLVGIL